MDDHDNKQGGHDIKNLWIVAKSYIRKHMQDINKNEIRLIEKFVDDLYVLDPTSQSTR